MEDHRFHKLLNIQLVCVCVCVCVVRECTEILNPCNIEGKAHTRVSPHPTTVYRL